MMTLDDLCNTQARLRKQMIIDAKACDKYHNMIDNITAGMTNYFIAEYTICINGLRTTLNDLLDNLDDLADVDPDDEHLQTIVADLEATIDDVRDKAIDLYLHDILNLM